MKGEERKLILLVLLCIISVGFSATDPDDLRILNEFRKGLENPELLKWPENDDDPCGPPWPHVFCSGNKVTQIQVQGVGLKGPLPQDLNQLSQLSNLGFQKNSFNGKLPTFKGLFELEKAYLDYNEFDTIPFDFAEGLNNLQILSLDENPLLNKTTGWSIPLALQNSLQLTNLSLSNCNVVGTVPDFLGKMTSLSHLKLSYNRLSGEIPPSFNQSSLQTLWLNNQGGGGLSGPIDVISSMGFLTQLWLHGNQFTGTIPAAIHLLSALTDLNLNSNQLVGPIPDSMATMDIQKLDLSNNNFVGPIPKFKSPNASYSNNPLCQSVPGVPCAPEVTALIDFLGGLGYPVRLASSWVGNDPCQGPWLGLACNANKEVTLINLPNFKLNGTLSPSLANLLSLVDVKLGMNNITNSIPKSLTSLKSLLLLDVSNNNIKPPLPKFRTGVKVLIVGNPLFNTNQSGTPLSPDNDQPSGNSESDTPSTPTRKFVAKKPERSPKLLFILIPVAVFTLLILLAGVLMYYCKKRKGSLRGPKVVVHPRNPSDPDNMIKIVVSNSTERNLSTTTGANSLSRYSSGMSQSHVIESGNLIISVQVLRDVTKNFAPENELGRGGFGTVYKGEFDDETHIAVKRMEASVINNKALDEFQSEIAVLSKVRHRHLVSLLGYSIEGYERLLVYEYLPQGALSKHLFHWKDLKIEPLSWMRRLNIALDVARGMEYLHTLAHQCFIHRDLKSSNILLTDDYRAKVSDFGLVKLAPDGRNSIATRLAGTFGYLAPEYAVTGKITTKVDVFSFGVVLMEMVTGLVALDEKRSEESCYLASWFVQIKSSKEKLKANVDPALDVNDETFESISIIADLAGHCTAREPNQRPDMGHAVNVLCSLVEKWKPFKEETEEHSGIDYSLPLGQMVKDWKETEGNSCLDDSKGSIPSMHGIPDSFNSGR